MVITIGIGQLWVHGSLPYLDRGTFGPEIRLVWFTTLRGHLITNEPTTMLCTMLCAMGEHRARLGQS